MAEQVTQIETKQTKEPSLKPQSQFAVNGIVFNVSSDFDINMGTKKPEPEQKPEPEKKRDVQAEFKERVFDCTTDDFEDDGTKHSLTLIDTTTSKAKQQDSDDDDPRARIFDCTDNEEPKVAAPIVQTKVEAVKVDKYAEEEKEHAISMLMKEA